MPRECDGIRRRAIARGLLRRDPDLLDRLIEQYQHRLLRYLVYLSGNRELAEDLFQETWIRVLERGHQYDGRHEFSTWLYAVARNLTIDYLRKKSPVSLDGLMEDEEHPPLQPADTRPTAWEVVQQHERAERISAALVSIPAEYRGTSAPSLDRIPDPVPGEASAGMKVLVLVPDLLRKS